MLMLAIAAPAFAAGPPEALIKMLNEAARADEPNALELTTMLAKRAYPESALEIDRTVRRLVRQKQRNRRNPEPQQSVLHGWTGELEIGGSRSTGNTNETSLNIAFHADRESLKWRNRANASADYKRASGITSVERFLVNDETQFKVDDRLFTFGLLQWERDRFAGFVRRFSESAGVGYALYHKRAFTWDVTLGPAARQTRPIGGGPQQSDLEARLGTHIAWFLSPTTTLTEDANFYFGPGNNTYQTVSAITTRVIGSLAARASFDFKKETSQPVGTFGTDTISRLTLVYGF